MISAVRWRPATRAGVLGGYILAIEWTRALAGRGPGWALPALLIGGLALGVSAAGWPAERLGLGKTTLGKTTLDKTRLWLRVVGGAGLGAVLLLPAAARWGGGPLLAPGLALAAVAVSVGEELAFRGALYAALEDIGGAPAAVLGTTLLWTLAHALSHPPAFLGAVAAAGLLLALWRWAFKDLVAPVVAHVIADLAL